MKAAARRCRVSPYLAMLSLEFFTPTQREYPIPHRETTTQGEKKIPLLETVSLFSTNQSRRCRVSPSNVFCILSDRCPVSGRHWNWLRRSRDTDRRSRRDGRLFGQRVQEKFQRDMAAVAPVDRPLHPCAGSSVDRPRRTTVGAAGTSATGEERLRCAAAAEALRQAPAQVQSQRARRPRALEEPEPRPQDRFSWFRDALALERPYRWRD